MTALVCFDTLRRQTARFQQNSLWQGAFSLFWLDSLAFLTSKRVIVSLNRAILSRPPPWGDLHGRAGGYYRKDNTAKGFSEQSSGSLSAHAIQ